MSLLRPYITTELTAKSELMAIELGTPYRTYCYSCGIFINPDRIQGHQAHCTTCNLDTGILCKGQFHDGDERSSSGGGPSACTRDGLAAMHELSDHD